VIGDLTKRAAGENNTRAIYKNPPTDLDERISAISAAQREIDTQLRAIVTRAALKSPKLGENRRTWEQRESRRKDEARLDFVRARARAM